MANAGESTWQSRLQTGGVRVPDSGNRVTLINLVAIESKVKQGDECSWNHMDYNPEVPGSNPGGSILYGAVAQR